MLIPAFMVWLLLRGVASASRSSIAPVSEEEDDEEVGGGYLQLLERNSRNLTISWHYQCISILTVRRRNRLLLKNCYTHTHAEMESLRRSACHLKIQQSSKEDRIIQPVLYLLPVTWYNVTLRQYCLDKTYRTKFRQTLIVKTNRRERQNPAQRMVTVTQTVKEMATQIITATKTVASTVTRTAVMSEHKACLYNIETTPTTAQAPVQECGSTSTVTVHEVITSSFQPSVILTSCLFDKETSTDQTLDSSASISSHTPLVYLRSDDHISVHGDHISRTCYDVIVRNDSGEGNVTEAVVESLVSHLRMDKQQISAVANRKTSQEDGRLSSRIIGWIGVIFLVLSFVLMVLVDVPKLHMHRAKYCKLC